MNRTVRLLLGLFCLALFAQAAEARRFRIFSVPSFGRGETIDPVYDLPNQEPFQNEGKYVDVGFLNGLSGNFYVLYHGDRYRQLDDEGIAILNDMLGFDPTAKHRAQYSIDHADEIAAAKAERAHQDERIAQGKAIERRAGESNEDYAARKAEFIGKHRTVSGQKDPFASNPTPDMAAPVPAGSSSLALGLTAILVLILIFAGRRLYAAVFGLTRAFAGDARSNEAGGAQDHLSFDKRVAQRLNELQGAVTPQAQASAQGESTPSETAGPAVRTFGRKSA